MVPAERTCRSRRALLGGGYAVAAGLGATVLAACTTAHPSGSSSAGLPDSASKGSVSDRPVTLTYLNWFGPSDPQNVLFPHALKEFQQRHPQVHVEQIVASGSIMEKYLSLAAAGTAPDVAALNPQYVEPLRARGALADLTAYVKRDAKSFLPEDLNEATLLRARKGGNWHAIPLQMGLWFLVYNGGLVEQAGTGKPDAAWTWDRLLDAARTVKNRSADALGMTMPPYELPVRGNGGDILSQDEKKCLLDQAPAVEAIQWNADLRQKHRVVPSPDETGGQTTRQLFDAGRYIFHVGDPGFLSQTQRGKLTFPWDIAVVPKGKVVRVSTVKGPSLVLSSEGKEKDTSWAWLSHYTGVEMQRFVAVEGKVVSARTSALKAFVNLDEGYNKQALLDVAAVARPMPYVARYDEMDREIQAGLDAAYTGQRPAKEALAEVARKVNDLLATTT